MTTHNGKACKTHGRNNSRHPLRWSVSLQSHHAVRNFRAPSPRVPPEQRRRSLSIRLGAASWSDGVAPNVSAGRHVRCAAVSRAVDMFRLLLWGAPSLRAASSLLGGFSPSAANLLPFSPPAGCPFALTLSPTARARKRGSLFGRPAACSPRHASHCGTRPHFPSRRGSRSSLVALAPPRFPSPACRVRNFPSVGCRGRLRAGAR